MQSREIFQITGKQRPVFWRVILFLACLVGAIPMVATAASSNNTGSNQLGQAENSSSSLYLISLASTCLIGCESSLFHDN